MKRLIQISLLVTVYVLVCGKSCSEEGSLAESEVRTVMAEKEAIREAFEVAYLDEGARVASEEAAMQKLADLPDLLAVLADTALDDAFRDKAVQMVRNTFIPEDAALALPGPEVAGTGSLHVRDLLQHRDAFLYSELRFDSIRVLDPLARTAAGKYEGALKCLQRTWINDSAVLRPEDVRVKIVAVKNPKVFGPDTLLVWEVFLGDMTRRD